jgi:D-lactate dehydrogenase
MKAVVYSIKPYEKEFLAKANQKKHDITLISNSLDINTAIYAEGKDAVIVFPNDKLSAEVIEKLARLGIKYIVTRSVGMDHIDKEAAEKYHIKLSNVPSYSPQAVAEHAVAMAFALDRQLLKANRHSHIFDLRNDELIGFTFFGKTVGIIGMGDTGQAAARIYNGLGCKVLGFDINFPEGIPDVHPSSLEDLLASSDIISIHLPLTPATEHLIQKSTLAQMKKGVMLINTSRGGVIKTQDLFAALESGKIGYLGLDIYAYEKDLFFEDHQNDPANDLANDPVLKELLRRPNVLITPHQAYLTKEALQEIANLTIKNLDLWQMNKCAGDACSCATNCKTVYSDGTQNNKANAH